MHFVKEFNGDSSVMFTWRALRTESESRDWRQIGDEFYLDYLYSFTVA